MGIRTLLTPCRPQELRSGRFWRPVLAEAVGTLVLVGVVLGASAPAAPSPLQPALAGGLAAAALACCFGHVSGAQANPALTLAGLCARKLDAPRAAAYLLAQGLGALLAAGAFHLALPAPAGARLVTRVSTLPTLQPPKSPPPPSRCRCRCPWVATQGRHWPWSSSAPSSWR